MSGQRASVCIKFVLHHSDEFIAMFAKKLNDTIVGEERKSTNITQC